MFSAIVETWRALTLRIGDALFGPLLDWSLDLALIALTIVTIFMMLMVRRLVTRQALLRSTISDLRILRRLIRNTPASDKLTRRRFQATRARVARLRLWAELPSAAVSLVCVLGLISWAWQRLQYQSPQPGDSITLRVEMPASAVGEVVHMVPGNVIAAGRRWVQPVTLERNRRAIPYGYAQWRLTLASRGKKRIALRHGSESFQHVLVVGNAKYAPPRQVHGENYVTVAELPEYRPFGFVPTFSRLGVPAWFVAYFLMTLAGFQVARRLLRIS